MASKYISKESPICKICNQTMMWWWKKLSNEDYEQIGWKCDNCFTKEFTNEK